MSVKAAYSGTRVQPSIVSYLDKGYIHKIKETDKEPPIVWYLPHFPVCRPQRMTTKTILVFDASAKFKGTSLNEELYAGRKLRNGMFDVLLRFPRFPIAVACDVIEMYLQIQQQQALLPKEKLKITIIYNILIQTKVKFTQNN